MLVLGFIVGDVVWQDCDKMWKKFGRPSGMALLVSAIQLPGMVLQFLYCAVTITLAATHLFACALHLHFMFASAFSAAFTFACTFDSRIT